MPVTPGPVARPLIDLDAAVTTLTAVIVTTPRWRFLTIRHLRKRVDRLNQARLFACASPVRPRLASPERAATVPRAAGQAATYR